ncbi:transglycosylase SLT domain-containing protein [Endozoicomonas sp. SCSIO W0465]|uniref:transglycosylase SLT domain-containing protein n=1 Tax=Endozoicomonas sp. SCSIO W0465 TaxID=2918516 RepID=UPI002075DD82|nr:transglycosylase SLT domain-containing protein [Endozoicomonas sp. SCSIO W0465]USE39484.1 transglycosylase SLT domain-containing protein [Endozoicomonas sp. SCSIO W0465]
MSTSPSSSASTIKKETAPSVEKLQVKKPEKITPVKKAPVVVDDLWIRIQSGLAMDLDQNDPRIQAELDWYKHNKFYFSQISKRSEPYLYFIVKEAEARNVPLELALMPIVESSFDPFAYSHAGASGLWQFMPETGEHYGLDQNWWYDGRRDVVHSTRAALDYMQSLYNMFGDWELALAAFNSGPGRVQRAVRKNKNLGKSTRFWALDLPSETTAYVPKLIALGKVVRNPSKFGVQLDKIPNKPYFDKVHTGSQLDMAKASKLSGVELEELYRLNPGLNRWSTPPEGPHHLVVPVTHAEHFRTQLASLPPEKRVQWHRYTVKSGDTLGSIAMKYQTSVNVITEANNLSSTLIRIGQGLIIPVAAKTAESYTLSASQRLAAKTESFCEWSLQS